MITKNISVDSSSPIYSWPHALVEKSLRAIQTDGVLAPPVEDFFFTLADVDLDVLDFAVRPIIKTMKTVAAGILGGPGSGKTPLARIIALCASQYWQRELGISSPASFREASEFDSGIRKAIFGVGILLSIIIIARLKHPRLLQCPGFLSRTTWRPDVHDDGRLAEEPIRKMKGFTDWLHLLPDT